MTESQIADIVAQGTKELSDMTSQVLSIVEENNRLAAENALLKQSKERPVVLASKQELDAVMSQLYPGLKNNDTPTADKSDYQKVIDQAIRNI